MEWTGSGIVLAVRPHGETSAIVELLTEAQGRHAGLVRGGRSRATRPLLQPGNVLRATWRARLEDHLGNLAIEGEHLRAGDFMDDPLALSGLNAACALACAALPEREPHPEVFAAFHVFLDALQDPDLWPALYVRWEAGLLADLGYGIDLRRCAVTGVSDGLTHVSPRSGRAVCAAEAEPYKDKLLALPGFLRDSQAGVEAGDIANGLALTGYFLQRRVLWPTDRDLPESRERMIQRLKDAERL
ncbi:DNA repair protein RecO [Hyphobacterium marinum]|uniref:DNA repair protein RecO n=1 Tax=Hyphobacterium marinum TaxID=3116574 RepID=A0ABU7LYU8_9PROT|nr:DNA repair protein RecO [Hyphobacterium sp. Y6023]MEE2566705.1 DNA repair protein RecO [Hyphobacterium sp. Y6023]